MGTVGERLNNVEAAFEHVAVRVVALEYVAEELLARALATMSPDAARAVLDAIGREDNQPWQGLEEGPAGLGSARRVALDAAVQHVVERLRTLLHEQRYPLVQWRPGRDTDLVA